MSEVQFVSKSNAKDCKGKNSIAIDVSSYGKHPFCSLSPFTYSKDIQIPVPGMSGVFANSVEGVWQGLKLINGSIDETLFERKPRKRRGIVEGHKYGNEMLPLVEAREKIYVPSYTCYLRDFAPKEAIDLILEHQRNGKKVFVYDVENNGDIQNPEPLAHASVLARYLNIAIFSQKIVPRNKNEVELFSILDGNGTLEDKVDCLKPLLKDKGINKALRYRCIDHPTNPDDYHIGLYFSEA